MKLKGWKHIMSFTYLQTLKSKGFKIGTILTCILTALICAAVNVLPALLAEEGGIFADDGDGTGDVDIEEVEPINVNTLYVYSDKELDFVLLPVDEVEYITAPDREFSEQRKAVTSGDSPDMLLYIYSGDGEDFYLSYYRPDDEEVLPQDIAEEYADRFTEAFTQALYLSIGVEEADLPLAQAGIHTYMALSDSTSWMQEIMKVLLPMGIALIFYIYIVAYSQQIAQSMATEKSSKVIELLITSARPLAIITGKIAGTLLISATQVAIVGTVGGLAFVLTSPFALANAANSAAQLGGAMGIISSTVEGVGEGGILISDGGALDIGGELATALPGLFNIGSIIAVIIIFIFGFLFFALIAGLVGASVSRIEDLGAALQPLMLLAVVGFMLSYMPAALNFEGDMEGVITFSHFFPLSSPFALPSAILMGQIGAWETVIAVLIMGAMTFLAALLTAKVYEGMILYSGNRLKVLQILKMVKKR